jgi:U3 small nucleolar RNA-associated protein 11
MHFRPEDNKYTEEELLLLKNKDMGYILQSVQSEKKVCDILKYSLANKYNSVSCG